MSYQSQKLTATFACLLLAAVGCSDQATVSDQSTAGDNRQAAATATEPSPDQEPAAARQPGLLTVGMPAPKVRLTQWIQGQPIEEFEPGHTYVVEFWATWCGPCRAGMPHISKLQQQYEGRVTFIGVTSEDEATVVGFLGKTRDPESEETWSDAVTYALALDGDRATNRAYMEAAQQGGIPTAFVVGPDAHIEWIGHPGQIDQPLAEIVAGTWDRDEYLARFQEQQRRAEAMQAAMASLQQAQAAGDWAGAVGIVDGLLEQSPQEIGLRLFKLSLLIKAELLDDAGGLAEQLSEENGESPRVLNAIAWTLATEEPQAAESLTLALRIARQASALRQDQDAGTLDTVARVYYEQGNLDEAIAWQQQAVEHGGDIPKFAETLQEYIDARDAANGKQDTEAAVEGSFERDEAAEGAPE